LKNLLTYIALVCLLQASNAQQKTGSIIGIITDAKTGEPLYGVNVLLRGTIRGTATDIQGKYQIKEIREGTCDITFSLVGYLSRTVNHIVIQSDEETHLDLSLEQAPIQAEQVVVTASRREQSLRDVPVSVSTVTAKTIADRVSVTLDDALRYVSGVNMMQDQVNIRGSTGYSRGVGSRVLILIDGLPYITGDTGEITWETLPMFQIDRIEVVKGAGSALYGSSALGGIINVITKDISEMPEIRFRLFSGIYDKPRFAEWDWSSKPRFNSGGFISYSNHAGTLRYLISISRTVDESYRQNDVYHRWGLYTKMNYNFSQYQSAILTTNIQWRNHGNFFWWRSLREATEPADAQLNGEVNSARGNVSLAYKEFLSEKFYYTLKTIYYGNFWQDDSSGRINNTSASHVSHTECQSTYEFSKNNLITIGVAGDYGIINSDIFGTHANDGFAFFAQDEITPFESIKLTVGARYDWQEFDGGRLPGFPSRGRLNPKVGLVSTPTATTTLRASYGEGFRYPSISEIFTSVTTGVIQVKIVPNDSLRPERSVSYEIGGSQLLGERVLLDLAFFQNDFFDLIEGGVNPSRLEIKFNNVTRARIRGLELGFKADWFKQLIATDISYTYIDPLDLGQNAILKFRPRHLLYGSIAANYKRLQAGMDFRYVSRIETIDENLVHLAPIINGEKRVACRVIDIHAGYNLKIVDLPLHIGLMVKNLTNYHYVELLGNLAPIRTYYLSIEGIW
jgi:iron complex outermembrane receptor protein